MRPRSSARTLWGDLRTLPRTRKDRPELNTRILSLATWPKQRRCALREKNTTPAAPDRMGQSLLASATAKNAAVPWLVDSESFKRNVRSIGSDTSSPTYGKSDTTANRPKMPVPAPTSNSRFPWAIAASRLRTRPTQYAVSRSVATRLSKNSACRSKGLLDTSVFCTPSAGKQDAA